MRRLPGPATTKPRREAGASCEWRERRSALNPGRAALGEGPDLGQAGHGGVTGVRGQQCAVGPAQADCLLEGCSGQEAVEEARREAVATADAVEDVELHHRGLVERA